MNRLTRSGCRALAIDDLGSQANPGARTALHCYRDQSLTTLLVLSAAVSQKSALPLSRGDRDACNDSLLQQHLVTYMCAAPVLGFLAGSLFALGSVENAYCCGASHS